MIFGIGTDIVKISRMQNNLDRYGDRFARRILSDSELSEFATMSRQNAPFLAKRFAAKEAAVKALGTGFRNGLSLRHITISHDEFGKPGLEYSGMMLDFIAQLGINDGFVSISDEDDYAIAFVTLTK